MDNNRNLIVGLALAVLILLGILFFPGAGRHHDRMMSSMPPMSSPDTNMEDDSLEARDFRQTCTQCHGLPNPRRYTANEWPLIIERMKQHMIEAGIPLPDDKKTASILKFLTRNASSTS